MEWNNPDVRLGSMGALNVLQVFSLPLLASAHHQAVYPEALFSMAIAVAMWVIAVGMLRRASWGQRIAAIGYCALPSLVICTTIARIV